MMEFLIQVEFSNVLLADTKGGSISKSGKSKRAADANRVHLAHIRFLTVSSVFSLRAA